MKTRLSLLLALALSAACGSKEYAWTDQPYCVAPDGSPGKFREEIHVSYVSTRGTLSSGGWALTGREGEGLKSAYSDEIRFVAFSCAVPGEQPRYPPAEKKRELFEDGRVPEMCSGQKVLYNGMVKADGAFPRGSFAGVVRFPKLDPAPTCEAGQKLAFGSGP